jgi:steroid 5-alpha reductase family enzyme
MIKTASFLIITLVLISVAIFTADLHFTTIEWEALIQVSIVTLAVALICFIVGEITGNNSQVDKLWSLIPIYYAWHFAAAAGFEPRTNIMAILVTIWGLRLTYNFGRRGGYSLKFWGGEEDYRWSVLRQTPALQSRWSWMLFNLFFICLYQNILILLFTLPIMEAWRHSYEALGAADYLVAGLMLLMIIIETIADQQQYNYQTEKHRRLKLAQSSDNTPASDPYYKKGFTHTGLWKYMRHPNYAAEQGTWICFYLFTVSAGSTWVNWSIIGAILLLFLFRGSSNFSEEITASKYPEFEEYRKHTPRFIPWKFWQ